jgi:hypothetical protein
MESYSHYFEFILSGQLERPRFGTNAVPPRVGDLVDLSHISDVMNVHLVTQVKHVYQKQGVDEDIPKLAVVEITLVKQ